MCVVRGWAGIKQAAMLSSGDAHFRVGNGNVRLDEKYKVGRANFSLLIRFPSKCCHGKWSKSGKLGKNCHSSPSFGTFLTCEARSPEENCDKGVNLPRLRFEIVWSRFLRAKMCRCSGKGLELKRYRMMTSVIENCKTQSSPSKHFL